MGLLELSLPPSAMRGLPAGIPRKVLRRLIVGHALGVGSRVLVAGGRAAELMPFFDRLGMSVSGISGFDESLPSAPGSHDASGRLICGTEPAYDPAFDEACFDLAVASDLDAHAGSLFAPEAFEATATLLSCARAGGNAAVLVRFAADGCARGGHSASCFIRHLSHFPGELQVCDVPDGLVGVDPFAWIVGRRPRPGFLLASLRLPAEPPSRFGWHEQAEAAAVARREPCCRIAASGDPAA